MTGLARQLATAAAVHADLVDAALPGSGGDPDERPSPDPTRKPAPGNLGVMDHRHRLVSLLRWWVDAVRDPGEHTRVGQDVARMARWLAAHEDVMAPEDAARLFGQVRGWLHTSSRMMGEPDSEPTPLHLSEQALDQVVPQSVAAKALGVPVSTIWRRAGGIGGHVRIRDVMR